MLFRLRLWIHELLISIDQLFHVVLGGPKYILTGGTLPSADETISSTVGRNAVAGRRWAVLAEPVIDFIMGEGHCRRSIGH